MEDLESGSYTIHTESGHLMLIVCVYMDVDGEEEERDSVEGEDSDSGAQERDSHRREITVGSAVTVVAMETDDIGTLPAGFRIPDFDWLTSQHFGEGQTMHSSN